MARLYDALHAFESRYRRGAYPVHKRLRFEGSGANDIYDWILSKLALPDPGDMLDAGCGVGFGALRLAAGCTGNVTGVSLSADEIACAKANAIGEGVSHRVRFLRQSFDDVPRQSFDLVVAVESLKHSSDAARSVAALRAALRTGGRLVIVDDFYSGTQAAPEASALRGEWHLRRLYRESDYVAGLSGGSWETIDLTDRVPRAAPNWVRFKRAALGACLPLAPQTRREALSAFLGGLRLEELYARGKMAYKAIFFRDAGPR